MSSIGINSVVQKSLIPKGIEVLVHPSLTFTGTDKCTDYAVVIVSTVQFVVVSATLSVSTLRGIWYKLHAFSYIIYLHTCYRVLAVKGRTLQPRRGHSGAKERMYCA